MQSTRWTRILVLWAIMCWMKILAQDAGNIVNALLAHPEDCGTHEWQVTDIGSNCGDAAPCNYPQSWCSSEDAGFACVPLSAACQNKLQADAGTTTPVAETQATTPSPETEATTSSTVAAPTEAATPAEVVTALPTLAPITSAPQGEVPNLPEPGIRPLPVGPNGEKLVLFKVVGGVRPSCPDNSHFCCYWARNNECNDNAFFMQTYCRRSCQELRRGGPDAVGRPLKPGELITIGGSQGVGENAFGEPPGGTCQDLHPKCKLWANRGECKRNALFMVSICRPSCGQCPPCIPQCQTTCTGDNGSLYGGGCRQTCNGCAGR